MKIKNLVIALVLISFGIFLFENILAHSDGMTGRTLKSSDPGCICHNPTPTPGVNVNILGPSSMRAGDTATFRVRIKGGPLVAAGTDIASSSGNLILSPSETFLKRVLEGSDFELTHTSPKAPNPDTVSFTFRYVAPNSPNTSVTLYANGNSVNLDGTNSGDEWNFATNKIINLTTTSIQNISETASSYKLEQNFPNPFNPTTNIKYSLLKDGFVSLKIYDNSGKEVANIFNGNQKSGTYQYNFSASQYGLSSGVYFYKLESGDFKEIRKMILTK